jgi:hypothetical protein
MTKTPTCWRRALLIMLLLRPAAMVGAEEPTTAEKLQVMGIVLGEHDDKLSVLVLVMNQTDKPHTMVREDLRRGRIWLMRMGPTSGSTGGITYSSHPPDPNQLLSITIDPRQTFGAIVELGKPADFRMADFDDEHVTLSISVQIRVRAGEGPFKETSLQGKLRRMAGD